jgi:hypothetical protein
MTSWKQGFLPRFRNTTSGPAGLKIAGSTGRSHVFGSFFFSYSVVLLTSLVFGFFIYQQSITIITNNEKKENLNRLEQARENFDFNLENAEMVLTQILLNRNVLNLMYNQNQNISELVYGLKGIMNSLSSYSNNLNDFLLTWFIMFREYDYVLIGDEAYTTRSFFDRFYSQNNETFQEWIEGQYRKSPYMAFYKASDIIFQGSLRRIYE